MTVNGVEIATLTNRYAKIEGHWYREALAVQPDGKLAPVHVLRKLVEQ